jgi:ribulose kinase
MASVVLGIDVGTGSVRADLFDGNPASARRGLQSNPRWSAMPS